MVEATCYIEDLRKIRLLGAEYSNQIVVGCICIGSAGCFLSPFLV